MHHTLTPSAWANPSGVQVSFHASGGSAALHPRLFMAKPLRGSLPEMTFGDYSKLPLLES